jgi:uncharacterized membrane protein
MRVVIILLILIAVCWSLTRAFAKRGIKSLQTLFSALTLIFAVVCTYILFLSVIQGHSL